MKILWVKTDFLHPTTRGGQIRTLEIIRRLHARHEVHYLAFEEPDNPEGLKRAGEYSVQQFVVPHSVTDKKSLAFMGELARGLFSDMPVAISRWTSGAMRAKIEELQRTGRYDAIVCDFLAPAANFPNLSQVILFQHNVETLIWERHAANAPDLLRKIYFGLQAKRMFRFERDACRECASVIAVSRADARIMENRFGVPHVPWVPTGVDIDYFAPNTSAAKRKADLIFVGSMDWMPNTDGILWFVQSVLPLIRRRKPDCTLAVAGRNPTDDIRALASQDAGIHVTGTVPDVRPWLWGSGVSIVPLRIGGGTRLKIYEAMAARIPVVSTAVGAEGLSVEADLHLKLAETPEAFAGACVDLLTDDAPTQRMVTNAWELVAGQFSWDTVTDSFERALGFRA